MTEFYIKIARKYFSRILGGTCLPCPPPSPTPMTKKLRLTAASYNKRCTSNQIEFIVTFVGSIFTRNHGATVILRRRQSPLQTAELITPRALYVPNVAKRSI